ERAGFHDLGAPQERAHPSHQLAERKGFDQVVVGAGVETLDLVLDRVARGQHQDLGPRASGAQLPAELEAVARTRQHQIEDHKVGRGGRDPLEGRVRVADRVDRVALLRQTLLEELRNARLVLDHQYSHRMASSSGSRRRLFMKEMTNTAPDPAAKPAAKDECGCGSVSAPTAPAASRPNRRGRETAMGGTLGIIGARGRSYLRLKGGENMRTTSILAAVGFAAGAAYLAATASAVPPDAATASAKIESKSGSKVTGKATFTELPSGGAKVEIWIENATPGSH